MLAEGSVVRHSDGGRACFIVDAAGYSEPKYGIRISQAWLQMPDGVRLAADLFMPEGAAQNQRFPVLLEYLPCRKDESRARKYSLYSYFVQRGYVVARVDIRGTGNYHCVAFPSVL